MKMISKLPNENITEKLITMIVLTFQKMDESMMDHKKVSQETLASEDSPLLMHIAAELTILKTMVIKLLKPIYLDLFHIQAKSIFLNLKCLP